MEFLTDLDISVEILAPSISPIVSFNVSKPVFMIITAISIPTKASILRPVVIKMIAARSVDAEMIESFSASFPDATRESDESFSPDFFVYSPKRIFTIIAAVTIIRAAAL